MIKSIQNDGEFEGGKAMMHTRRCASTRVLLWPVRTPLKHKAAGHEVPLKTSKVVTRVVTDWISGCKSKYRGLSKAFFIGEQNRRSTKTIILLCTTAFDGGAKQGLGGGCKKATLSPLPPGTKYRAGSKIFLRFSPR